jgi:hypothetical protein
VLIAAGVDGSPLGAVMMMQRLCVSTCLRFAVTTDNKGGAASYPYGQEIQLYINSDTVAPTACQMNNEAAQTVANAIQIATQPQGTTKPAGTTTTADTTTNVSATPTDTIPATDTATTDAPPNPAVDTATQQAQADTAAADAILGQAMAGRPATTGQQTAPAQ